jgi:hypothetical protein
MTLCIMIQDSQQLGTFLKSEAHRAGMRLAFDTHYDAQNWQLSWWRGSILHRLDFQPLGHGELAITHYKDHFRLLPKLMRWAHRAIPLFPYLARIEWSTLAKERFPLQETQIEAFVSRSVDA